MELKIMQTLVQGAGTISGFNYAYCRILHDQAVEHLKTDIIDGNGNIFCLDEQAAGNLEKLLIEEATAKQSFNRYKLNNEEKVAYNFILGKTCFEIKEDSPLTVIFDQLEDQLHDRWDISSVRSLGIGDGGADYIKKMFFYLNKVNNFLTMFESE